MGLISYFKETNKKIESHNIEARRQKSLRNKLNKALFRPYLSSLDSSVSYERVAINQIEIALGDETPFQDMLFRKAVGRLCEFYEQLNPVLSSALWGILTSMDYFESRTYQERFFLPPRKLTTTELTNHYKALTSTAAIHFANGTANMSDNTGASSRTDQDEDDIEKALKFLDKINDEVKLKHG